LTPLAEWHRILFHHLAVTPDTKRAQEEKLLPLMDALTIDLVVPARYMHVLSPELRAALRGRCINIHHSFLPSFKGVRPYHQAHARGVKLIGATAHSVTADLDEGPIIEHLVERVDHTATPDALVAIGRDIESVVQARAVRWYVERRVLLNGSKTVVFKITSRGPTPLSPARWRAMDFAANRGSSLRPRHRVRDRQRQVGVRSRARRSA
jgi:formyltetrahydrofolate deformylase